MKQLVFLTSTRMRGLIRLVRANFSKKLSMVDTAKVIQDKIQGITQLNDAKRFGTVISIGDGIGRVVGLKACRLAKWCSSARA